MSDDQVSARGMNSTQSFDKNQLQTESVVWAYKLFLDREPENDWVVRDKIVGCSTIVELRKVLMASEEFKIKNPGIMFLPLSGTEPEMEIEEVHNSDEFFYHIQETWEYLGETEPHWSVITHENFKQDSIRKNQEIFYNSGRSDVDILLKTLARNGFDYERFNDCLEYGCGLGRVTRWLAEEFNTVYGFDISKSHLKYAKQYLYQQGLENVKFTQIQKPEDIRNLPKVDLVYSIIVIQHNPPPMMEFMITEMLKAINPGGVAFFQVPTYRKNYSFSLKRYLDEDYKHHNLEMHVLPQNMIFNIIYDQNCKLIEVLEDGYAGLAYGARSNSFLVQKNF
jgi:2-polyprenyl-3-methyl-5-hydroxy-6-metoxy-1,4-benzoquinol methylase